MASWPSSTTARRVCSRARHLRARHLPEQSTAAADFVGASGTPHSGKCRRTEPPEATYLQHPTRRARRTEVPNFPDLDVKPASDADDTARRWRPLIGSSG
jgi:hypothetical protein